MTRLESLWRAVKPVLGKLTDLLKRGRELGLWSIGFRGPKK